MGRKVIPSGTPLRNTVKTTGHGHCFLVLVQFVFPGFTLPSELVVVWVYFKNLHLHSHS